MHSWGVQPDPAALQGTPVRDWPHTRPPPPLLWVLLGREAALENSCGGSGECFEEGAWTRWSPEVPSEPSRAVQCRQGGDANPGIWGPWLPTLSQSCSWLGRESLGSHCRAAAWGGCRMKQSPPGEAARFSEEVSLGRACLETRGEQTVPGTHGTCPAPTGHARLSCHGCVSAAAV